MTTPAPIVDSNNPNPAPIVDPNPLPPEETEVEKLRKERDRLRAEKEEAEKKIENSRMNALREKQDFEQLAKINEEKAKDFETKYNGLKNSLIENAKMNAIKTAAIKAGVLDQSLQDLEMLDFNELTVETTSSGKIIVTGADSAIDSLKRRRPHWFGNKPASVNPSSPQLMTPSNGEVDLAQVQKLEAEFRKNPNSDQAKKAYHEAVMAFKKRNPN